jgi:phage baseplate assembly protein W
MNELKVIGTEEGKYYGTYNDITYLNGDMVTITGIEKLRQNIAKILMTKQGTNNIFPGFGSQLENIVNNRVMDDPNVQKDIINAIVYAFTYLNQIDDSAETSEKIDTIKSIDISTNILDGRQLLIKINVTNQDGQDIILAFGG